MPLQPLAGSMFLSRSVWVRTGGKSKRTLIFAVTALDLLVELFLNITFQNSRSGRLVKASGLEDMGCVDPVVMSPPHHMLFQICAKLEFINRYLQRAVSTSSGYAAHA